MNCSNCGKYISRFDKHLTDSRGNRYCSVGCHWQGTHKKGGVNVNQTDANINRTSAA